MLVDMMGNEFAEGQRVAKGVSLNSAGSAGIQICTVTKIQDGRVYLDDSKQPTKIPSRLLIL